MWPTHHKWPREKKGKQLGLMTVEKSAPTERDNQALICHDHDRKILILCILVSRSAFK